MISQTAEYALRAIVYLGERNGMPCTTARISEGTDAPVSYLAKVMKCLIRAGIVASQRGPTGGFVLTRQPSEITILEIVNSVDAVRRIDDCPLGRLAHSSGLCPLHQRMDNVLAAAESSLRKTTIGELIDDPEVNNLCRFPCISEPVSNVEGAHN